MSSKVSPAVSLEASLSRWPPLCFFLISAIFHYLGPAFAVVLFQRVAPLGVAWLRIATAAAVFALASSLAVASAHYVFTAGEYRVAARRSV